MFKTKYDRYRIVELVNENCSSKFKIQYKHRFIPIWSDAEIGYAFNPVYYDTLELATAGVYRLMEVSKNSTVTKTKYYYGVQK